jgi:hypothetical protein
LLSLSESPSDDSNNLIYIFNDDLTASVNGSTNKFITDLFIPSFVEYEGQNYTVTELQDGCFNCCTIYGKVTFPSTLVSIGAYSFSESIKDFIDIVIPDSVKYIKDCAFMKTNIIGVSFGCGIQSIGNRAFRECVFLEKEIIFPESLKTVGSHAFVSDPIIGVRGGKNITSFGVYCFGLTGITYFSFPSKLTEIAAYIFYSSKLEGKIVIPMYVSSIGSLSFASTKINDIIFPLFLKEICDFAFMGCTNLSLILKTDNVLDRVGVMAFCLTGLIGIDNLLCNKIDELAFAYCKKLQSNAIIMGATEIEEGAFKECPTEIEEGAFKECTSLKSITISTNNIPKSFAEGCSLLESIEIEGIDEICDNAFSMCSSLKSVKFPNTIKRIGAKAFYCCESYSGTLPLNNYTQLEEIGDEAFLGCNSLVGELVFPNSLTKIGEKAFIECKFTGSIFIPNSVKSIGDYAFFGCHRFSGMIMIGNGCTSIGESVFSHCTGITGSIHIGNNVTSIGARAFFGCNLMTGNLEIPASVKIIGDSAFTNCISLKGSLILHDGLETIGESAFAECTGLSGTLTLPSTLKNIGSMAFFKCIGFEDVYFESNDVLVEFMAFSRMHNKCFSNVPDKFDDESLEKYDSDNFAGAMLPASFLNMNCGAFRTIDTILVTLTSVCCSGGFIFVAQFLWSWLTARSANITKLILVVKEIIANVNKEESGSENEKVGKIINSIQDRLTCESQDIGFNTTKSQAEKAVIEAIDEEWPTILPAIKRNILEHSLDEIKFYQPCACCIKKSKESPDGDHIHSDINEAILI